MTSYSLLKKVISGGQVGADIAGLRAAKHCGIETGGWAPPGFLTQKGPNPKLGTIYHLKEIAKSRKNGYVERSKKNVDDSGGTIAFKIKNSAGTGKTIGYALSHQWRYPKEKELQNDFEPFRPVIIVNPYIDTDAEIERVILFILEHNIETLNICGHGEGVDDLEKWEQSVFNFLVKVYEELKKGFSGAR